MLAPASQEPIRPTGCAASDGTPVVEIPDVFLEGGDSLVGPDFWLVGKNAVKRTAEIAGHLCDDATALAGSKRSIVARFTSSAIAMSRRERSHRLRSMNSLKAGRTSIWWFP